MPAPIATLKQAVKQLVKSYYSPSILFIFFYGVLLVNKFALESQGSLIDYFQNISPDGYDWISQGEQLGNHLFGAAQLTQVPLLRDPGFTFILAINHLLGGNGIFLGLIQGICFIAINTTIIFFANCMRLGAEAQSNSRRIADNLFCCALLIGNPLNWVYAWILAEPLAVFASLVPIILLIKNQKSWLSPKNWILSGAIAGLSSLIQTYALIPFICAAASSIFEQSTIVHKSPRWRLVTSNIASIIFCVCISVGTKAAWRGSIPHESVPESFSLIKISSDMIDFYINTWAYVFLLPILLIILTLLKRIFRALSVKKLPHLYSREGATACNPQAYRVKRLLIITTTILATLCIFYQWKESRFSFIMYPYIFALAISCFRNLTEEIFRLNRKIFIFGLHLLTAFALCFQLYSDDIWRPSLASASIGWPRFPVPTSHDESRRLSCQLLEQGSSFKGIARNDPYLSSTINFRKRLCLF